MKARMWVKVGVAIAGALMAGKAFAQGPCGGGPGMGFGDHRPPMERSFGAQGERGRWWNNPRTVERLKLTDAQRKAMDETMLQHREKLVDLRGTLEKAELELDPMTNQDQPNEGQILSQIDKVAAARAELEKANARFLLAIRSKLTPEQWKQVQAERASRPHGWEGRDGQGPGGQGRPNWQRRGQAPAPPQGDGQGAAPAPAGPQSRMDGGPGPEGPPPADEGASAVE